MHQLFVNYAVSDNRYNSKQEKWALIAPLSPENLIALWYYQ